MDLSSSAEFVSDGDFEHEQAESIDSQVERFSVASASAGGLVNLTQGGLILGRSKQLVRRLVIQGRLTPYEFFGRMYLSVNELKEFRKQERLPGRPWHKQVVLAAGIAAVSLVDSGQRRHNVTNDFKNPKKSKGKKK